MPSCTPRRTDIAHGEGRHRAWHDFRQGLIAPSGTSLIIALITAATLLLVFFTLVLYRLLVAVDPGYWAASPTDHDAFTTGKLLAMTESKDNDLLIAIIGASVTRSSFGSEAEIEEAFAARHGIAVDVENFSTSRQSLWEHLGILRLVAGRRPTIALVGIGPIRFTADAARMREIVEKQRLGVKLPGMDEQAAAMGIDPPRRTGIYAYDNWPFLAARLKPAFMNWIRGPIRQNEQPYLGREKRDWDEFSEHSRLVAERLLRFDASFGDNLAILDRMQRDFGARDDLQLVFLEHPINPKFVTHFMGRADYDQYLEDIGRWSTETGANYWQIALALNIDTQDYFDWAHIRTATAKAQMRSDLVERLVPLVRRLEDINEQK